MSMTLEHLQDDIKFQMSKMSHPASIAHTVCGLSEEAGEVAGLLKRQVHKEQPVPRERWVDEFGDVLWYLVAAASVMGITMDEVYEYNRRKLEVRYGLPGPR